MNKLMNYRYRIITLLVLAVVLSAATYGFAAANTVPNGVAGEGEGVISGYVVTNVNYTLDSSNPTAFASVSFDLGAPASQLYVGIGNGPSIYWTDNCSNVGTVWTCILGASTVNVHDATSLHISAAE